MEGTHLAYLYGQLISHLSGSHLEPTGAYEYIANELIGRKSSFGMGGPIDMVGPNNETTKGECLPRPLPIHSPSHYPRPRTCA